MQLSIALLRYACISAKVKEVNSKLLQVCKNNKWEHISYKNIVEKHLNPYGVHLNRHGTIALAKNFTDFLKATYCLSIDNSCTVEYENGNNVHSKKPSPNTTFRFPKLKGFRIAHLNIGSLIKHFDELLIYMHDKPFDILTLNETRLDDSILNSEIKISGYDIVRRDRNRNGGGVAMYIRSVYSIY